MYSSGLCNDGVIFLAAGVVAKSDSAIPEAIAPFDDVVDRQNISFEEFKVN